MSSLLSLCIKVGNCGGLNPDVVEFIDHNSITTAHMKLDLRVGHSGSTCFDGSIPASILFYLLIVIHNPVINYIVNFNNLNQNKRKF